MERMLEIKGLKIHFDTEDGVLQAVDGVDLGIDAGETLGVVGESGCGKSVTALTVMRLLRHAARTHRRRRDPLAGPRPRRPADDETIRALRAREIAMIFQEPMTSLNPVYTVGEQIAEVVRLHENPNRRAALVARGRKCCGSSTFPIPSGGSTITRTSFRAACASA